MTTSVAWAVNLAVTGALVGLIWLVQVVQYPGFAGVGPAEFVRFHAEHSARITVVVGPLMLAEVLSAAWLIADADDPSTRAWAWACAVPVALAWLSTAFVQVPIHGALAQGDPASRAALVERLVTTNWLRTAAWTFRAAALLWLGVRR
jgi:hypothetical protein